MSLSLTRRPLVLATAAALPAIVGAGLVMAPAAHADDFYLSVRHSGTITTHMKTLNQDVTFKTGELTKANLGVQPWAVSSTITPEPGHTDLTTGPKLGNLKLASFDISILPDGPATGALDISTGGLSLTQRLNVQITKVTAFGTKLNLVPATCKTGTTAVLPLTGGLSKFDDGSVNPFGSVHLSGTLDIPAFKNCGLITPLINLIASGPGNTVTIDLGEGTFVSNPS